MKKSIVSLALVIVLAGSVAADAAQRTYSRADYWGAVPYGYAHAAPSPTARAAGWFHRRRNLVPNCEPLSRNPNCCVISGCVGAGGGGD